MVRAALVTLLVGCGPKIDPLLPMKAELAEARRAPAGDAPHARLVVAQSTAGELVKRAVAGPEPFTVPVMLGTVARVSPTLADPSLTLSASPGCDCPRAEMVASGTVDVELGGLLGKMVLADDLPFTARASGAVELAVEPDPETGGQRVVLQPVPADPWAVGIQLERPAGMINDQTLQKQVSQPIEALLARPLPLFALPAEIPVRLQRLELERRADPTTAVWLVAAHGEPIDDLEIPDGFAIATTEANLLAGARAAFAELPQTRAFRAEPTGLTVDEGEITLDLRLHKVARKPKWRAYRVRSTFAIGESVVVRPVEVVRTGKRGFGGSFVGPFVDARVRKQLLGVAIEQPASVVRKVGASEVTFRIASVDSPGSAVIIRGAVE